MYDRFYDTGKIKGSGVFAHVINRDDGKGPALYKRSFIPGQMNCGAKICLMAAVPRSRERELKIRKARAHLLFC